MTGKRTPADVLREARKSDSVAKRSRVLAVIDEMKARDEPITFLGVARAARVSNSAAPATSETGSRRRSSAGSATRSPRPAPRSSRAGSGT